MNKLILTIGITLTLFAANTINAQVVNKTDVRQANQQARIAEGVASGELTRYETKALRAEQRAIRRTERRVEADGIVTRREQRKLNKMQNKASRDIARQKNDPQSRY